MRKYRSDEELTSLILNSMRNINPQQNWKEIVKYARKNEVIIPVLQYLKKLNDFMKGLGSESEFMSLFNRENQKYNLFWQNVHEIHRIFSRNQVNYAIIKTNRIYNYYDWDINILISQEDWTKALNLLSEHGWGKGSIFSHPLAQSDPGKLLLERRGSFPVDLHKRISWHGLEYLPSEFILSSKGEIEGIYYPSKPIDALIHCAHSIFQNYELTLGQIYHLMNTFNATVEDYISVARKNGWSGGAELVINKAREIWNSLNRNEEVKLPYRYELRSLLKAWNQHAWGKGFGPYEISVNLVSRFLRI